jgi:hypothetical protein
VRPWTSTSTRFGCGIASERSGRAVCCSQSGP